MLPRRKKPDDNDERRQYKRVRKHFLLRYYDLQNPDDKIDLTQLKNISKGGMCFITSKLYEPGVKMGVELNTPFLTNATILQGEVKGSVEKAKDLIYETRLEFEDLNSEAEFVLDKLMEFFSNQDTHYD